MMRRVLVVVLALAATLAVGVVDRANGLDADRGAALAELRALSQNARTAEMRSDYLAGAIEVAESETSARATVIEKRPAFIAELTAFGAAMSKAEGKIDTSAHRASALSTQQTVLAEREDPEVIEDATATIHALTQKIDSEVATWQASQLAGPGGPVWTTSGPDGYARVRAALDRVGGSGVGLYESASCAGGTAPACANSSGYIKYRADITGWSDDRLNWAMAHELAHIYQFRVWGALTSSGTYSSLFGGDPEFLANCMALVRGFPGAVGCNGAQREWASGIWVGVVR